MYLITAEQARNAKVTWNFGKFKASSGTFHQRKQARIMRDQTEKLSEQLRARNPYSTQEHEKIIAAFSKDFCEGKHAPLYMSTAWLVVFDRMWRQAQEVRRMNEQPPLQLAQAKQKFGGARVYMFGPYDEGIETFAQMAETVLSSICEFCGSTHNVKPVGFGWTSACCTECAKLYEEIDSRSETGEW